MRFSFPLVLILLSFQTNFDLRTYYSEMSITSSFRLNTQYVRRRRQCGLITLSRRYHWKYSNVVLVADRNKNQFSIYNQDTKIIIKQNLTRICRSRLYVSSDQTYLYCVANGCLRTHPISPSIKWNPAVLS